MSEPWAIAKDGSGNGKARALTGSLPWPGALVRDGASLFWIERGTMLKAAGVMKLPTTGGAPTPLASRPATTDDLALAIDDAHVYWSGGHQLLSSPR